MAAYGIGNGYTTEEEWATFRDAESEEAATEAAQVILINLGQGQSGFAGEPGLPIIVEGVKLIVHALQFLIKSFHPV